MKSEDSSTLITRRSSLHAIIRRTMMNTILTISKVLPNGASSLIRGVGSLILVFAAARSAPADYATPYYDRESWMSAQGDATFSSFETSETPLGYFTYPSYDLWEDRGVRFSYIYGGLGVVTGSESNYGFNLANVWGVDPSAHALRAWGDVITWDVTVPSTSIAIECAVFGGLWIHYHYGDGTGAVAMFQNQLTLDYQARFFGVIGTAPIVSVELFLGDTVGGGNIRSYLKSFSFGAPIPAPPVAILLLGGLIGISRRRS